MWALSILATHNNRDGWSESALLIVLVLLMAAVVHFIATLRRSNSPLHRRIIHLALNLVAVASLPTLYASIAAIPDTCPGERPDFVGFSPCYSWWDTVAIYLTWGTIVGSFLLAIPYGITMLIVVLLDRRRDRKNPPPKPQSSFLPAPPPRPPGA